MPCQRGCHLIWWSQRLAVEDPTEKACAEIERHLRRWVNWVNWYPAWANWTMDINTIFYGQHIRKWAMFHTYVRLPKGNTHLPDRCLGCKGMNWDCIWLCLKGTLSLVVDQFPWYGRISGDSHLCKHMHIIACSSMSHVGSLSLLLELSLTAAGDFLVAFSLFWLHPQWFPICIPRLDWTTSKFC